MKSCRLLIAIVSLTSLLFAAENEVKPETPSGATAPTAQSLRAELTSLEATRAAILGELNERYAAAEPAARTALEAEINRVQIEQEIAFQSTLVDYYDLLGRSDLAEAAIHKLANLNQQAAELGISSPLKSSAKEKNNAR